jgi:hypothetical protein
MVYVAVATAPLRYPLAAAIAFSVSVEPTVIGPLYTSELVVGLSRRR